MESLEIDICVNANDCRFSGEICAGKVFRPEPRFAIWRGQHQSRDEMLFPQEIHAGHESNGRGGKLLLNAFKRGR